MKSIGVEELALVTVLTFLENAAELGCPKDQEVDTWFRYLCDDNPEEAYKVSEKLIDLITKGNDMRK